MVRQQFFDAADKLPALFMLLKQDSDRTASTAVRRRFHRRKKDSSSWSLRVNRVIVTLWNNLHHIWHILRNR